MVPCEALGGDVIAGDEKGVARRRGVVARGMGARVDLVRQSPGDGGRIEVIAARSGGIGERRIVQRQNPLFAGHDRTR